MTNNNLRNVSPLCSNYIPDCSGVDVKSFSLKIYLLLLLVVLAVAALLLFLIYL